MPMLEWNDGLSLNIADIDAQHKTCVDMVNELYDSMKEEASRTVLLGIVDKMRKYTEWHFGTEEALMSQHAYPDKLAHEKEHREFIDKVAQVESDCKAGKSSLSMDVLNFLSNWLVTHIFDTDKKLGVFLTGKGVR